jgi:NADH dehydrogenase (ubiquinone) Fe-S protein 2
MLAVSCHALDVGNMSALFWAFEIREKLMEFYERLSGARMHAAIHSFNNPYLFRVNRHFLSDVLAFIPECYTTLNEMHNVLSYNKIWKQRLVNVGSYDYKAAQAWSLTGVLLRCTGVRRDLRLNPHEVYSGYDSVFFKSFLGLNGDCFDRFNIRMLEMAESLNIANQAVNNLLCENTATYSDRVKEGYNAVLATKSNKLKKKNNYYAYMEDLIEHFLSWHTGGNVSKNINSTYIESPKGEFGVTIISDNSTAPLRCKIRSPSYFNLQFLPQLTRNHFIADLATLVGTIDIVFGEVDR